MDFYFIDERGNTSINFETIDQRGMSKKYEYASKYFQLAVLMVNNGNLEKFQNHFNSVRYFLNFKKEFERYVNAKRVFCKLWDIIEDLSRNDSCSIVTTYLEKEFYSGPYLFDQQVHRFRMFNIYRILSYAMKSFKTDNSNKAQIIIDRFPMTHENEMNAIFYLKERLKKYYKEIELAFIDSRCSDYLQVVDVVMRVVDEKELEKNNKFKSYNTEFIIIRNFT